MEIIFTPDTTPKDKKILLSDIIKNGTKLKIKEIKKDDIFYGHKELIGVVGTFKNGEGYYFFSDNAVNFKIGKSSASSNKFYFFNVIFETV